jgi:hypothetical protein
MRYVIAKAGSIGIDTLLVLLLLTVEYARAGEFLSIDSGFMGLTVLAVLVLPYFLPSADGEPFGKWIVSRVAVVGLGLVLGSALPESMRSVPLTLLLAAAMASCYVQFYGLTKLRLAK